MKRGDFVTVAINGDFGKPRPALLIQSNLFSENGTLTVILVTSTLVNAPLLRITVEPNVENGLQKTSQVMIDKIMTVNRDKIGSICGTASEQLMLEVQRSLAVFLGIA